MDASAFDPTVPFTRTEATTVGLTPRALAGAGFMRLQRNVYVARTAPLDLSVRARAALVCAPRSAVISHHTAAVLWGGAVPESSEIHVTVPRRESLQVSGVRTHRSDRDRAVTRWRGVSVTTPEQTFADLGPHLDLVQLVVLGDSLIRGRATSAARLVRFSDQWNGHHRLLVRRSARLTRLGVDSVPESKLRLLILLAGLPEPRVNLVLRDPDTGAWMRRFELAYDELRLAIEYEGRQHRSDDEIWAWDIDRREELDRRDWRVVQVLSDGLYASPLRTLQRIEQARRDRGAAPSRAFSDEWKRYFPGRRQSA
jgi:hypothetical protein